jgi:DNA-binding NtrC family response regulator
MGQFARILVIDDDKTIRLTMAAILRAEGFTVDTAETGREAIEKSYANNYNVALIDIKLPDIMGTELLDKLKPTDPPMIKIIVTGFPAVQNAIEAVNKGANAYILKPADPQKLLQTVKSWLQKQKDASPANQLKVADARARITVAWSFKDDKQT